MAYSQTSVTVTDTAANIFAAGRGPKNFIIQNNDAAGIVYINLSGTATASSTMIMIYPNGGSIELKGVRSAVSAIGSIASNANVAVIEWM